MSASAIAEFLERNQRWAGAVVNRALARAAEDSGAGGDVERFSAVRDEQVALLESMAAADPEIPFFALCRRHALSLLESQIVALCLARQIDPALGPALGGVLGRRAGVRESLMLTPSAVAILFADDAPGARIQALSLLSPESRLRATRILAEVAPSEDGLLATPLLLTTACLHLLLGHPVASRYYRWSPATRPEEAPPIWTVRAVVSEAQRAAVRDSVAAFAAAYATRIEVVTRGTGSILVLLWGPDGTGKTTFARELAGQLFDGFVECDGAATAKATDPARVLEEVFDRATLSGAAVLLRNVHELLRQDAIARLLIESLRGCRTCVVVTSRERDLCPILEPEWHVVSQFKPPGPELSAPLWRAHLLVEPAEADLLALVERYSLSGTAIARAARLALAESLSSGEPAPSFEHLERAAALQIDVNLGTFVRTIFPTHGLEDLVLPPDDLEQIYQIIEAWQSWHHVMGHWGLGERLASGKCISALFYGEPGTGKTFAAEVIAATIQQPIHIVSLPNILSKWFGETERNIHDLFGKAKASDAVLLLDEADSLFASRVEVRSAQDQSMNMMTALLLQELDRHTGLVIMTTNLTENIDRAFQRRIMFNLEFPKPDEPGRAEIWRRLIPAQMPIEADVNVVALAREFELSGGEIKNAILRASFRAYAEGVSLAQHHLVSSCQQEYSHTGRLLFQKRKE